MANYSFKLTPTVVTRNSEGSLDTSVVNGVSAQRTGFMEVYNGTSNGNAARKIVSGIDGKAFTDTLEVWSDAGGNIVAG